MTEPARQGTEPEASTREAQLAYEELLPVLGIPVRFESNDREVMELVEESFGSWRGCDDVDVAARAPALRVRVVVHEEREPGLAKRGQPPVRRSWFGATRLMIKSPRSSALTDPTRREAVAYVTTELVAMRDLFRHEMLEVMTLSLLAHFDRHLVHAAAIAHEGRALLLVGPAGVRVNAIALAQRTAFDVLSDDRAWIQRQPALRIWGWPRQHAHAPIRSAPLAVVCLLERGARPTSLVRVSAVELVHRLASAAAPTFDHHPEHHRAIIRELAAPGGFALRLSPDAADVRPFLLHMLGAPDAHPSLPAPRSSSANRI
jgi:hypothetical protein